MAPGHIGRVYACWLHVGGADLAGDTTAGIRPLRLQEKFRPRDLQRRRHRLAMFQRVAGLMASVLWGAGAQPAAAPGAGVSGMSDSA
eukprot:8487938-Pyramimonas_sp.AAC.1